MRRSNLLLNCHLSRPNILQNKCWDSSRELSAKKNNGPQSNQIVARLLCDKFEGRLSLVGYKCKSLLCMKLHAMLIVADDAYSRAYLGFPKPSLTT